MLYIKKDQNKSYLFHSRLESEYLVSLQMVQMQHEELSHRLLQQAHLKFKYNDISEASNYHVLTPCIILTISVIITCNIYHKKI